MRSSWNRALWWQLSWILAAAILCGAAFARGDLPAQREVRLHELPQEARTTLDNIRRGGPHPYDRDASTFGNYEKRLPLAPRGHYREYTVETPGLSHRGARRIVVGCDYQRPSQHREARPLHLPHCRDGGEFYYTADHYRSFRRILE